MTGPKALGPREGLGEAWSRDVRHKLVPVLPVAGARSGRYTYVFVYTCIYNIDICIYIIIYIYYYRAQRAPFSREMCAKV